MENVILMLPKFKDVVGEKDDSCGLVTISNLGLKQIEYTQGST